MPFGTHPSLPHEAKEIAGMSTRIDSLQHWAESVGTAGASTWAGSSAVASQLPGKIDGPAGAYRHLLISAELCGMVGDSAASSHEGAIARRAG